MKDIEIEIRLPLNNCDDVFRIMEERAKRVKKDDVQKDIYYSPKHRDFMAYKFPYEWLRLRQTPMKNSITYKYFHPENSDVTDYCDEYETDIGDFKMMEKIFYSLDMVELVRVEKNRNSWLFKGVEVSVDRVTGLGDFIELELKNMEIEKNPKNYLREILDELGAEVGQEDFRGYPYRLLKKKGYQIG